MTSASRKRRRQPTATGWLFGSSWWPTSPNAANSETICRDGLDVSRKLVRDFPKPPEYRQDLARSQNNLANLLFLTGRPEEATTALRDALAVRRQVAGEFRSVPEYQSDLAVTLMNLASLLRDTGSPKEAKEAEEAYAQALVIGKRLAADFPSRPEFRDELALCQYNLAKLLHQTGRSKEAVDAGREALALQKQLAADYP